MKKTMALFDCLLLLCILVFASAQAVNKSTILKAKCVGCGDCVRSCPVTAIKIDRGKAVVNVGKCIGCRLCVITCSYGAAR
ncbi:MAG: 4Fe-4S binding protein [Chitinivibrionales bacterium]